MACLCHGKTMDLDWELGGEGTPTFLVAHVHSRAHRVEFCKIRGLRLGGKRQIAVPMPDSHSHQNLVDFLE